MGYSPPKSPDNPYASVAGSTWEGGPPGKKGKYAIPRIGEGTALQHLGANPNPGLGAMQRNLSTLTGQPMSTLGYSHPGFAPPMGGGSGGSTGSSHSPSFSFDPSHGQERIGNAPGTFALPSMISPASGVNPYQYLGQAAQRLYPGMFPQGGQMGQMGNFQSNADLGDFSQPIQQNLEGMPSQSSLAAQQEAAYQNSIKGLSNTGKPIPNNTGQTIMGRAKGGNVKQVQPYIVGEKGPELFIPHQDGEIVPHKDVKKYVFKALQGREYGGHTQGSGYMTYRMPIQQNQGMGMYNPMMGYGQQPQMYGQQGYSAPSQYPQGFNPYAAQFLQQFMPQQQQMQAQVPEWQRPYAQALFNNPVSSMGVEAPDNPMAMARYIRMGLQDQARKRLAGQEGAQRVAELKAAQVASGMSDQYGNTVYNAGSMPPNYVAGNGSNFDLGITSKYGKGSVKYAPSNTPGMFTNLDMSGNPVQGLFGGSFPLHAPDNDPGQTTFSKAEAMSKIKAPKNKPSPLASLLGSPS